MKNMLIAGLALVLSLVAFAACQNNSSQNAAAAAPGTKYICPMNCEKGKTYDQPGTCPVCNMKLEATKTDAAAAPKAEYFMDFKATPAQIEVGKPAVLSFTPRMKGNESAPVPLDLVHEKKMHLILVSDDLASFDHIHPEYSASGDYQIKALGKGENFTSGRGKTETRFESGGKFWAFADYKPTGGLNTVDKIELNVAGTPAKPMNFPAEKLMATVDGFAVKMEGSDFTTGSQTHIPVSISKGGKPVDPATFENYLGEKAHLVLIEVGSKEFVHTHPAAGGGKLEVHTTFAKPGTYRGWLQFQTDGVVHTADFVLKVAEKAAQ
jgi:hypothetical protein